MSYYDETQHREILDVPTVCPECGSELEIDTGVDGSVIIRCKNNNCKYEGNFTDEFNVE